VDGGALTMFLKDKKKDENKISVKRKKRNRYKTVKNSESTAVLMFNRSMMDSGNVALNSSPSELLLCHDR